jgi:hypothetical protein
MPVALFGINNEGLNLAVNLIILFLVVVWIALVVWTFLDARRRLEDPVLVASATAASLFPFVGSIVYSILRPPEFIEDRRERELEIRAAELRVRQLEESACPNCGFPIERSYLRCPSCRARVKDPCESCGKPIDPRWSICPYCESPVRRAAPPPEATARPSGRSAARRPAAKSAAPARQPSREARQPERKESRPARKPARSERAAAAKSESGTRPPRRSSRAGTRPRPTSKSRQSGGEDGGGERKPAPDTESQPAAESERQPATES